MAAKEPITALYLEGVGERRAVRMAVAHALNDGLCTDGLGKKGAHQRSLMAVARKLGVTVPDWADEGPTDERER